MLVKLELTPAEAYIIWSQLKTIIALLELLHIRPYMGDLIRFCQNLQTELGNSSIK